MNIFDFIPKALPFHVYRKAKAIPWFRRTRKEFKKQTALLGIDFPITRDFACLLDISEEGGVASGHYFHQDLLVAQAICKANPSKHIDIGSRIDGFVAHVASFRSIEVLDIRVLTSTIPNVSFTQADCMALDTKFHNYSSSISSLHALEHFGLGRYGDPIDAEGHLKGLNNIYLMLKTGGTFYLSVPIGKQRVEFNAHRVFGLAYLVAYFEDKYNVCSFSYVDDKGDLHRDVLLSASNVATNCNCRYGCGIFVLEKK